MSPTLVRLFFALMLVPPAAACRGEADVDPTVGSAGEAERPIAPTSPAIGTRLETRELTSGEAILTDSTDRPLYVRLARGEPCDAVCDSTWPAVGARQPPAEAGVPAVLPTMIGSVLRDDGRMQVTYNGRPLHYRTEANTGAAPRVRVTDRWGEWSLLRPTGEPLAKQ